MAIDTTCEVCRTKDSNGEHRWCGSCSKWLCSSCLPGHRCTFFLPEKHGDPDSPLREYVLSEVSVTIEDG